MILAIYTLKWPLLLCVFFDSGGLRCVPVTVVVDPKRDVEAELTDKGFKPPVIRLDEGSAIQWKWSACEVAHTINEATYSHRTGRLHPVQAEERSAVDTGLN